MGPLHGGMVTAVMRVALFIAGLCVAAPVGGVLGLSHAALTLVGLALAIVPFMIAWRAGQGTAEPADAV